jgi:poly-gamma-glutamate capsule biosynthesis protein CapA/YwtB (metallophosphatase superfamily)
VSDAALQKGLGYLQNQFQQAGEQDHERKATILQAQAAAGVADFAHANRLHRLRTSLNTRSLALLMIALADMGRAEMGQELAPLLLEKVKRTEKDGIPQANLEPVDTPTRWGGDSVEVTGLALLALIKCQPTPPPSPEVGGGAGGRGRTSGTAG